MLYKVHKKLRADGFTLIEILVAMAILAVIGVATLSIMNTATTSRDSIARSAQRLNNVERFWYTLSRDILQLAQRLPRNEFGDHQSAFFVPAEQAVEQFELVRLGRRNPADLPRSNLERVRYQLKEQQILRISFPYVDGMVEQYGLQRPVLDKVESIQLSFFDGENWSDAWPPDTAVDDISANMNPLAVRVTLQLTDMGTVERLFALPDAAPLNNKGGSSRGEVRR